MIMISCIPKIFTLFIVILFCGCQKFQWNNPYDAECPKYLFTPNSLKGEMIGDNVKLNWQQENTNISGFELYRISESESILRKTPLDKDKNEFIDFGVVAGKTYTYSLVAVAGDNKSDTIKFDITVYFNSLVATEEIIEISTTDSKIKGNVINTGGDSVTARGFCWSVVPNPTTNINKTIDGAGSGQFISTINNLEPGTRYYVRAYAQNSRGISYGGELNFITKGLATPVTSSITTIGPTSVVCGGNIFNDGGLPILDKGICYSTGTNPTIDTSKFVSGGSGLGAFTKTISGLIPSTTYYIRAYATNSFGTSYGEQINITTKSATQTLTTNAISNITAVSAQGGGVVTNDAGLPIVSRGICWSKTPNPTIQDSKTIDDLTGNNFTSFITGLEKNTIYYVRAYTQNQFVTSYGNEVSFNSALFINGNGVTDVEGTKYKTVIIGNQEWMAENLKTLKLNNGDAIPNGGIWTNWQNWGRSDISCYADPETSSVLGEKYGRIYNIFAVNDSRKICPTGWHVPSLDEWRIFENYIGANESAIKMKSTDGWGNQVYNGNNLSGINALPAGGASYVGLGGLNGLAYFWTSKVILGIGLFPHANFIILEHNKNNLSVVTYDNWTGASVRCIKD
jgi:uncharacterized protein (TIGR02145 family)